MGSGYPKMLYRDGSEFRWDGRPTDSVVVQDAEEAEIALLDGWKLPADYLAPRLPQLDHDGDGRPGGSLPRRSRAQKAR